MNDFTKHELELLLHWGIDRLESVGAEIFAEEEGSALYEKLYSLIDNYCELKVPTVADYGENG